MTLSLPPFTKAVTWLIGINTGVFLLMGLLSVVRIPVRGVYPALHLVALVPLMSCSMASSGNCVTYSFLHAGFGHWFWNMIGLVDVRIGY